MFHVKQGMTQKITQTERMATRWIQMLQSTDQESENTGFWKAENNKNPNAEGKQHTGRNKLKEDLQVMWHKGRLLQMCERYCQN